jgi:hypothetical protein
VSAARGNAPEDAARLAILIGGISLGVLWPLFIVLYAGGGIVQMLDHLLLYRIRMRELDLRNDERSWEINSQESVRMREIDMQQSVGMARQAIEAGRQQVAQAALISASRTPTDIYQRTPAEEKLIHAIVDAYEVADPVTGYIPNDRPNPFGKRALGTEYAEIVAWLADPARRVGGVVGAPAVAEQDRERKMWRINLERYPTADVALQALCGRRT